MQPNLNIKKSLLATALLLGISNASHAATGTYTVTAGTIQDVQIAQATGNTFTFGTGMYTTTGGTCSMDASNVAEAFLNVDLDGADGDSGGGFANLAAFQALNLTSGGTGGCIDKDEESYGLFVVTGEPDSFVTLTVSSASSTEFDFVPGNGCVPFYDGNLGGDVCAALTANTPITNLRIPGATESSAAEAAGVGVQSVSGELQFTVGGTVTVTNGGTDLTGGTAYSVTFPITVLYE